LKNWGVRPIFASTEVVFDGRKGQYTETDCVNPVLTYAKQKVEIENFIETRFKDYLIVRLALVYGSEPNDNTLLTTWAKTLTERKPIACAHDYLSSPVYIKDVVESIIMLIQRGCQGIYHLAGKGSYSRCDLLDILLSESLRFGVESSPIRRCSINDFDVKEPRPLNVTMIPDKLIRDTGINLRSVEDVCREVAEKIFRV